MRKQTEMLRRCIGMGIMDVRDNVAGIVLELAPAGRIARRRLLLTGVTGVTELRDHRPPDPADDDQAQIDIGDDMYERSRYDDKEDL